MGDVEDATEATLKAASHLTDLDLGAVEALRVLARKIDTDDALRQAYLDDSDARQLDRRPLQLDNVSIPTYLKFCESLGLTPSGRSKQPVAPAASGGSGGKLAHLRSAHQASGKSKAS